jgi:hypothetical protein
MSKFFKSILRMLTITIVGILIIISLFKYSSFSSRNDNNFIRLLPPHMISDARQIDLGLNSFYLSGLTNEYIYLGNKTAPTFLLRANYNLTDTLYKFLKFPVGLHVYPKEIQTIIDSPYIFCMEGITPAIQHGDLFSLSMTSMQTDSSNFNASIPISTSSFIIRSIDTGLRQNILIKTNINTQTSIRKSDLLEKQIDGIFCTDGMLSFDAVGKRIYYVYYYRNQFLCMDTNLNLIYKGKTIDTVTRAHLKIAIINSQNSRTLAEPPLMVNKSSCTDGSFLFIHSKLRADNEEKNPTYPYSVIDIYNLKDGKYRYSFFVPDNEQGKMITFRVLKEKLVVLYDHSLMTFHLNIPHSE